MRAIRNPILLVLLLVAVGAGLFFVSRPRIKSAGSTKAKANASATAAKDEAFAKTNPQASGKPRPERPIDIDYVQKHAKAWIEAPARDPFLAYYIPRQTARHATNAPVTFVLTAVWRQSGGVLAVINGIVCGEGDELAGFRVERIENDQVLLENAERRELVRFPMQVPETIEEQTDRNPQRPAPAGVSVANAQ